MKINVIVLIVYLAALGWYTNSLRPQDEAKAPSSALAEIPLQIGPYGGFEESVDERTLAVLGADETLFREYRRQDGPPIWVFLGYFAEPRENSQIHSPKHCYPGSGWSIDGESRVDVRFAGDSIDASCLSITDGQDHQTVFYWFHTDSGIVTNEFELKWLQMKNTLLQRSRRATFVRFSTLVVGDDGQGSQAELKRFVDLFAPHVAAALDRGGEGA